MLLAAVLVLSGAILMLRSDISLKVQPRPDAQEYATSANQLAHGWGYTTPVRDNSASGHLVKAENPPLLPAGISIGAQSVWPGGPFPWQRRARSQSDGAVHGLAIAAAAVELGGPLAAVLAVLLLGTGSFVGKSDLLVLSDAFAAGLAVAVLALLTCRTPIAIYLAGFLAGYGVLVRASGLVVLGCLLVVLRGRYSCARSCDRSAIARWSSGLPMGDLWKTLAYRLRLLDARTEALFSVICDSAPAGT